MSRERRQHRRIDARIEVRFETAESYAKEYSENISKGGIYLKTDKLPDPNAVVELTLHFPGLLDQLKVLARVARMVTMSHPENAAEQVYGVGFYFVEWSHQAKQVFDKFYQKLLEDQGDA